jgi:hypothetical protein
VLDLAMSEADLFEVRPLERFAGMPPPMAMIILCRALWPTPMRQKAEPMHARIAFGGRPAVRLDELGDWDPF